MRVSGQKVAALLLLATAVATVGARPAYANGPRVLFIAASRTLAGGFRDNQGVAVDTSGDVFVSNFVNGTVDEIVAVNGSIPVNPTVNTVATGFNGPEGLAVDASGDIFVANANAGTVQEIVAVGGSIPASPTINTVATGLNGPGGLARDALGDIFVANNDGTVYEIVAAGGSIPANPTVSSVVSLSGVRLDGVAVDASGNLYVANIAQSQS